MAAVAVRRIFDRVPPHVRNSFTVEQREAIALAADEPAWSDHPVNFRLSLPTPAGRVYFALVAGRERRDATRRGRDPMRNPMRKRGNLAFIMCAAILLYATVLAVGELF